MAYKILTKNGIDNSNIDGARGEYFNSGMRDGIVQGVLNEGLFTATASNIISLDTCELRIAGHRIVIDEPVYHTFSNAPRTDTRYAYVAQIIVGNDQSVDFSLFIQTASTPLIQNDLYKTISGAGTYQVEIGRFTLLNTLKIVDVVKTIDTITGAGGVDGDYIRIGKVITTMLDAGLDAEVDAENVTNQTTGLKETNFYFGIPKTAGSVVNVGGQQVASVNFTSDPQTQLNEKLDKSGGEVSGDVTINNGNGIVLEPSSAGQTYDAFKFYAQGDDIYVEKQKVGGGADYQKILPLDDALSTASTNAVQNKVITEALNNKTTVNISNVAQDSINFTSDPQTQLNEKLDTTELLNKIYPIGSIYISVNQTSPASFIGGTWQALDEGRTLWTTTTAYQGGTMLSAGLPNIEGSLESVVMAKTYDNQPYSTGALSFGNNIADISGAGDGWWTYLKPLYFNANDSNDIYGSSSTVQPPAHRVYMWKRTA